MAREDTDRRDLLGIGEFASLTGLTISTLRHYHQAGLLVPGEVDRWTGYRRYQPDQAQTARTIRAMRYLQMPLDGIRRLLRADEGERKGYGERTESDLSSGWSGRGGLWR